MNALLRKGITIAMSVIGGTTAYGQLDLSKYEFGITAGIFIYSGDLTPAAAGSYRTPSFNLNLFANRILNSSFSLRTQLAAGSLRGNDAAYEDPSWRQQRNLNFKARTLEVAELLVWNPLGNATRLYPYAFGGLGLNFIKVKRDGSAFNNEYFSSEPEVITGLSEDLAHPTPKVLPVLPVGIGIQYALTKNISVTAETSYRITRSDYVDGFSKAANPDKKDQYQSHTAGIIYRFGKKSGLGCPDPKKMY